MASEWRIFWAPAPGGARIPTGSTGIEAVEVDTLPLIKRLISEELISGVVLIGARTAAQCLEALHSYARHVPYVIVLDRPWLPAPLNEGERTKTEFLLSLADWILATDKGGIRSLETFAGRLAVPIELLPGPSPFSERIQSLFLGVQRPDFYRDIELIAFAPAGLAEYRLAEWRRCLPPLRRNSFLVPNSVRAFQIGRWGQRWPGIRWLRYHGEEAAIRQINAELRRSSAGHMLFLTPSARLHPGTFVELAESARQLPLAGLVGASRAKNAPARWKDWLFHGEAWALRHRGATRAVAQVHDDCFLLQRAVSDALGGFDPALGWSFGVIDLCIKARQNGFYVFQAEAAMLDSRPLRAAAVGGRKDFHRAFLNKWNLSPIEWLRAANFQERNLASIARELYLQHQGT